MNAIRGEVFMDMSMMKILEDAHAILDGQETNAKVNLNLFQCSLTRKPAEGQLLMRPS